MNKARCVLLDEMFHSISFSQIKETYFGQFFKCWNILSSLIEIAVISFDLI